MLCYYQAMLVNMYVLRLNTIIQQYTPPQSHYTRLYVTVLVPYMPGLCCYYVLYPAG